MTVLCLTGWQQPADALTVIAPDARHIAYAGYDNVPAFLQSLPKEADLAIGWSLGGQLLMRAVAGGHLRVQKMLLLAPPFQFLASDDHPQGMPQHLWGSVLEGYRDDPPAMLKHFCGVISAGDNFAARITRSLRDYTEVWKHGQFWLEELGRFSCATLDFSNFPPVTIIQGDRDKVVYPAQAQLYKTALPDVTVHSWEGCAHAPHLHNPQALQQLVSRHV